MNIKTLKKNKARNPLFFFSSKNIFLLIIGSLSSIFSGCSKKYDTNEFKKHITDSTYIAFGNSEAPMFIEPGSAGSTISFIKRGNPYIYTYNITNHTIEDSISLVTKRVDDFIYTDEGVYYLLNNNQIEIINKGKSEVYYFDKKNEPFIKGEIGFSFAKFSEFEDTVCFTVFPSNTNGYDEHLRNTKLALFTIKEDSLFFINTTKMYLPVFFDSKNYLNLDFSLINGHEAYIVYSTIDSLFKINLLKGTYSSSPISSSFYEKNAPFDWTQAAMGMAYSSKFNAENYLFSRLFFNKEKDVLLLFLKHKKEYLQKDGTKTNYYDCPFSLLIIDKKRNVTKEIFIPEKLIGETFHRGFVLNSQLYLPAHESKQDKENETKFYIINTDF